MHDALHIYLCVNVKIETSHFLPRNKGKGFFLLPGCLGKNSNNNLNLAPPVLQTPNNPNLNLVPEKQIPRMLTEEEEMELFGIQNNCIQVAKDLVNGGYVCDDFD